MTCMLSLLSMGGFIKAMGGGSTDSPAVLQSLVGSNYKQLFCHLRSF